MIGTAVARMRLELEAGELMARTGIVDLLVEHASAEELERALNLKRQQQRIVRPYGDPWAHLGELRTVEVRVEKVTDLTPRTIKIRHVTPAPRPGTRDE